MIRTASRQTAGALALCLLFAGPLPARAAAKVVIITPHVDAIRHEFARGFAEWHQQQFGEPAEVEWRNVGGTADALRFIQSEYANKPDGIGLDMLFGGGQEPYYLLADKKLTSAYRPRPDIFDGLPRTLGGMELHDANFHWFGAAISSFGILQNTFVQRTVGLPTVTRWSELADPRIRGWVGAGDPRNSSTMYVMYESFLQAYGWEKGWATLTQIGGNARNFDRQSSSTAKDVTLGETAYAFAIDFYGASQIGVAGPSNMVFTLPADFTAINADGICILKGAPNLQTAQRFIDFVLSEPGQKLWFLPRGHPEGPKKHSLERSTIRPDLYKRFAGVSHIELSPFDLKMSFVYNSKLGRDRRDVVAALIGALLVDTHSELKAAWEAMIARKLPPADLAELGRMPLTESEALALAKGEWKDPAVRNRKKIEWQNWARAKYRKLAEGRESRVESRGSRSVASESCTARVQAKDDSFLLTPHPSPLPIKGRGSRDARALRWVGLAPRSVGGCRQAHLGAERGVGVHLGSDARRAPSPLNGERGESGFGFPLVKTELLPCKRSPALDPRPSTLDFSRPSTLDP
jgi:ABC-type Fe3+ transport system substrate-binding protein